MSNKTLTAKLSLTYTNPGGQNVRIPEFTVNIPYQSYNLAVIDVPDTTADSETFDVPFGSVAGPTFIMILNRLDQPITITITSGVNPLAVHTIPAGGAEFFAASGVCEILTSVEIGLTDTQVGDGLIECYVFGDPTA